MPEADTNCGIRRIPVPVPELSHGQDENSLVKTTLSHFQFSQFGVVALGRVARFLVYKLVSGWERESNADVSVA